MIYIFENTYFFQGQLYAGEWLKIHTRQSEISLAMARVVNLIPCKDHMG